MTNEAEQQKLINILANSESISIDSFIKSAFEAIELLSKSKTGILFMDTTYDYLLQNTKRPPFLIGISQNSDKENVSTWLEKGYFDVIFFPFDEKRIINVVGKIINIHNYYMPITAHTGFAEEEKIIYNEEQINRSLCNKEYMFIHGNHKMGSIKIYYTEIFYINNVGNEIRINLENGIIKYVRTSLKSFLANLPQNRFVRINRSLIINIDKVMKVKKKTVDVGQETFTISRSFYKNFMKVINL